MTCGVSHVFDIGFCIYIVSRKIAEELFMGAFRQWEGR